MTLRHSGEFKDFGSAVSLEYVTTSGSGAYSSSTVCGANARRYHALLAAPLGAQAGFLVCLSALDEVLTVGNARFSLFAHEYPGAVFPQGYTHIEAFEMDPLPTFTYAVEGIHLRKKIAMAPDEVTVVVSYKLLDERPDVTLEVMPLVAFRPRHALSHENPEAVMAVEKKRKGIFFKPYESLPSVRWDFPGDFIESPNWYKNVLYRREGERGHEAHEDLMTPGYFRTRLKRGKEVRFLATLEKNTGRARSLVKAAEDTAHEWSAGTRKFDSLTRKLVVGMRDFLVNNGRDAGVLRGLPWHYEWSRHAMMALAGLAAVGKVREVHDVLSTWARRARGGMLPLYVDDAGKPHGVDPEGSLWFFEAVANCLAHTKNYDWVRETALPFMHECLETIISGRPGSAEVRKDGLLYTDASNRPLAPRQGALALVEMQALYFNALKVSEDVAAHFRVSEHSRRFSMAAKELQGAYNKLMWDSNNHVPVDSLAEGPDLTTRPMCLFAVALTHPILIRRRWEILVDQAENALLTPFGLMAVPVDYAGSKAYFPGDSFEDARRRGGIWPEFLGAYLAAHTRTFGWSPGRAEAVLEYLRPLELSLLQGLQFHVAEFFDGVEPFTARGAPANAAASGQLIWALTTKVFAANG